jgi:hypothetical protein
VIEPQWTVIGAAHILGLELYRTFRLAYFHEDADVSTPRWVALTFTQKLHWITEAETWLQAHRPATELTVCRPGKPRSDRT